MSLCAKVGSIAIYYVIDDSFERSANADRRLGQKLLRVSLKPNIHAVLLKVKL